MITGIATVKGTCWRDQVGQKLLAVTVSEDVGGYFDGVYTAAHEFAHRYVIVTSMPFYTAI